MTLNILLTDEIKATMPKTVKMVMNFGRIQVIFPAINPYDENLVMFGDNAVVEAETNEVIKWLKPFDGIAIGVGGSPQFEQFEIKHIDENL
jgi:hypothetical protein